MWADPPFEPPQGASVEEQWALFIKQEERKRVGMACFILEAELTSLFHLPPSIWLSELKTTLPSDEESWSATTAEAWHKAYHAWPAPPATDAVLRQILEDTPLALPPSLRLPRFAAHVLVGGVNLLILSSRQLRLSGMTAVAAMATLNDRRSLSRLGGGPSPFEPTFGATGPNTEQDYSASAICYHFGQIGTYLASDELDLVAGRGSPAAAVAATERVRTLFSDAVAQSVTAR